MKKYKIETELNLVEVLILRGLIAQLRSPLEHMHNELLQISKSAGVNYVHPTPFKINAPWYLFDHLAYEKACESEAERATMEQANDD